MYLRTLVRWDVILFHRNRIFVLAAVLTALYTGIFFLLKPLGSLNNTLVILIFNDPVVTGYLFAAVLLLFDRNQSTLQAVSVLPVPFRRYLLSKALLLAAVATLSAVAMTLATRGLEFQPVHLALGTFASAFMFASFGFTVGSLARTFNQLLFYSVPFFVITGLPALTLAGAGTLYHYVWLPTAGSFGVLQAAFTEQPPALLLTMYAHLVLWTWVSWKTCVHITPRAGFQ